MNQTYNQPPMKPLKSNRAAGKQDRFILTLIGAAGMFAAVFSATGQNLKGDEALSKVLVDGELEISSFDGDEGGKRMTFRVIAATYRLLGNGRQTAAAEERAQE